MIEGSKILDWNGKANKQTILYTGLSNSYRGNDKTAKEADELVLIKGLQPGTQGLLWVSGGKERLGILTNEPAVSSG